MKEDLSRASDHRGDEAIFIEQKNFEEDGWRLKQSVAKKLNERFGDEVMFFRVIINGEETASHGWIETKQGDVAQWG